jgi:hypothetical protein
MNLGCFRVKRRVRESFREYMRKRSGSCSASRASPAHPSDSDHREAGVVHRASSVHSVLAISRLIGQSALV